MTAYQLGIPNVLSVPSGASNIDVGGLLRYVPDGAEVWLAVDMDEAGDRAAESFYSQLDGAVRRLIMPTKDLNEWLIAKPDLRAEDVLATVSEVVTKSEQEDEEESLSIDLNATDLIVTDPVIVCRTPWDGLTRRLDGGFRQGGTTGILAPSGIGKTTIANNLIAQALAEGVKVAAVQLEGTKSDIISKLRKTILEWNANIDFPELQGKLLSNLRLANMFGKDVAIERTIKFFRQMAKSGHRFLVIDNWDFLTGDGPDGLRKKAKAYSDLLEICKEYNAHAITVWQPKKVDRKEKVNSGHQKGFSTALQDADNYLTVNAEGRLRKIEVEKARVPERDGVPSSVWLKFDPDRMILEQIANPGGLHEITKGPTDL